MGNTLKRGKQQKKDSGIDTSTVRCEVRNTLIVLAHSILLCVRVCWGYFFLLFSFGVTVFVYLVRRGAVSVCSAGCK